MSIHPYHGYLAIGSGERKFPLSDDDEEEEEEEDEKNERNYENVVKVFTILGE